MASDDKVRKTVLKETKSGRRNRVLDTAADVKDAFRDVKEEVDDVLDKEREFLSEGGTGFTRESTDAEKKAGKVGEELSGFF